MAIGEVNSKFYDTEQRSEREVVTEELRLVLFPRSINIEDIKIESDESIDANSMESLITLEQLFSQNGSPVVIDDPITADIYSDEYVEIKDDASDSTVLKTKIIISNLIQKHLLSGPKLIVKFYVLTYSGFNLATHYVLIKTIDAIRTTFSTSVDYIESSIEFCQLIKTGVKQSVDKGVSAVKEGIETVGNGVKQGVSAVKEGIETVGNEVKQSVYNGVGAVKKGIGAVNKGMVDLVKYISDPSFNYEDTAGLDAQIAALLCHYAYFYLDCLEAAHFKKYVLFGKRGGGYEKQIKEADGKFKEEKKGLGEKTLEFLGGIGKTVVFGGLPVIHNIIKYLSNGDGRVKIRVINRLYEIAKIVNSHLEDEIQSIIKRCKDRPIGDKELGEIKGVIVKKFLASETQSRISEEITKYENRVIGSEELDKIKKTVKELSANDFQQIISDIIRDSEKKPIDFYDLYDRFGYWDYIEPHCEGVKKEAENWHVLHPLIIAEKEIKDRLVRDRLFEVGEEANRKVPVFYNTVLIHGMSQLSGYGGALFARVEHVSEGGYKPNKFVYVNKGTDANSLNDWLFVDVLQALTGFSLQHVHAVKNAIKIHKLVEKQYENIPLLFVGHSLGGGLSSSCAIATPNRHAITFNAAGLNFLGSCWTRVAGAISNMSYESLRPLAIAERVHPIRIQGEAVDLVMIFAKPLTLNLNERAYGRTALVFTDIDLGSGAKHGINNFLYNNVLSKCKFNLSGNVTSGLRPSLLGLERLIKIESKIGGIAIKKSNENNFEGQQSTTKVIKGDFYFTSDVKIAFKEIIELLESDAELTDLLYHPDTSNKMV